MIIARNGNTSSGPILVLGGSGFIGSRLVLKLQSEKLSVLTIGRSGSNQNKAASHVIVDFTRREEVQRFFAKRSFRMIFNCAGRIDPGSEPGKLEEMFTANVLPVLNLIETVGATSPKVPLIHLGSGAEYGTARSPHAAEVPGLPSSPYGLMKLVATMAVQMAARSESCNAVIARPFLAYGPGAPASNLVEQFISAAQSGLPLDLTPGAQTRDFIHVDAIAEQLFRLGCQLESGEGNLRGQILNICNGHELSIAELAELVREIAPSFQARLGARDYRAGESMKFVGVPWQQISKSDAEKTLRGYLAAQLATLTTTASKQGDKS